MTKKLVSLLLLYIVVFLTCSSSIAQTTGQLRKKPTATTGDLKEVFDRETQRSTELAVDVESLEKDSFKRRAQKNSLWEKPKTWIWIGVAAAAAITVLVLVTRKDDEPDGVIRIPDCRVTAC